MHAQQGLVCVLGLENGAIGNWSPIIHGLSKDHAVYNNQGISSLLSGMIGGTTKKQIFKYFYESFLAFFFTIVAYKPFSGVTTISFNFKTLFQILALHPFKDPLMITST